MFDLLSATSEEVGAAYRQLRAKRGYALHDPALPSFFIERPLLRHTLGGYIVVHWPLVFKRGLEGPYDISTASGHWKDVFGIEFGAVFQEYVGEVLGYMPNVCVVDERKMRQYTEKKLCDYLVVGDDFVLLVECKAVKYSATLVSENAIKQDNSTTKIAEAMNQFFSAEALVRAGVLRDLIGDVTDKAVLATVVTFRPVYRANDDAYWDEVVAPQVKAREKADWQAHFAFRPQVMDISEFERLVLVAAQHGATPLTLFREKLPEQAVPPLVTGDWDKFLGQRLGKGQRFPLWADAFTEFFREAIESFDQPGEWAGQ
jgi:hypothetical protein